MAVDPPSNGKNGGSSVRIALLLSFVGRWNHADDGFEFNLQEETCTEGLKWT